MNKENHSLTVLKKIRGLLAHVDAKLISWDTLTPEIDKAIEADMPKSAPKPKAQVKSKPAKSKVKPKPKKQRRGGTAFDDTARWIERNT